MYGPLRPLEVGSGVISLIILFHTTIVGVWECNLDLLIDISLIQKKKKKKKTEKKKKKKKKKKKIGKNAEKKKEKKGKSLLPHPHQRNKHFPAITSCV